jgi:hypothetical protein
MREALNDLTDTQRRDVMARFVLMSENARHRGWSPRPPRVTVNQQTNVVVGWAEGDDPAGYDPALHGGAPEPEVD